MTSTKCHVGDAAMFKNKAPDGKLNISGAKIAKLRMQMSGKVSQKGLADKCQLADIDLSKNAIQQIESGERFVTDVELKGLASVLGVTADYLLSDDE